ncbi:hypothetical protein A2W13_02320 [Candidatus Woesebacteria bacterium RBG_16_36_11]|uniref:Orotate phosphoribosyltransferase n=2 Tax=Candidatus Woeseibacteriota TaxID=1752722 RepID=A0A1F7X948_9BACT|nr:MAG: hypothetical protein A2W13_02320 [Candidatus Woesebacteria bacterium RBG_16_36_11]OGM16243.1 MAG: hypothetical protein A2V55_00945 [Candidatus Woesebacteria bacterium RBG_19FT_COMBO_37_29]
MPERITDPKHPEGLTTSQKDLAIQLIDIHAVKFGDFRLKLHEQHPDAPLSPIYIDLRMLRRDPKAKGYAVEEYALLVRFIKFDLLADVPTAATPLVSSLSDRLGVGMITPRTDSKGHGTGAKIDGLLPKDVGKKAILIDDLITRADSKIEAVDVLRAQGLKVEDVVVLIDREQGGKEQLEQKGLKLHSVFTMQQLLNFYRRVEIISETQYQDTVQRIQQLNSFLGVT